MKDDIIFISMQTSSGKIAELFKVQYLKKEVRDQVDFLHLDKHQSFL